MMRRGKSILRVDELGPLRSSEEKSTHLADQYT